MVRIQKRKFVHCVYTLMANIPTCETKEKAVWEWIDMLVKELFEHKRKVFIASIILYGLSLVS